MTQRRASQVLGLTTALGVIRGTNSAEFAISLIFSMVVMYDASGVRLHAGKTASVLNMIITVSAAARPPAFTVPPHESPCANPLGPLGALVITKISSPSGFLHNICPSSFVHR